MIVSLFRKNKIKRIVIHIFKILKGLLNNSDDNFTTRTSLEKEANKLALFIILKRKLEIRKETGS